MAMVAVRTCGGRRQRPVEPPEHGELADRQGQGDRLATYSCDDEQQDVAGGEMDRQQGRWCDVVDHLLTTVPRPQQAAAATSARWRRARAPASIGCGRAWRDS
jgi:hypothetical protein